jgi:hypothetical protein
MYLEHLGSVHVHTVMGLYPLASKVDGSGRPMSIVVVDRDKNYVLGENIELIANLFSLRGRNLLMFWMS